MSDRINPAGYDVGGLGDPYEDWFLCEPEWPHVPKNSSLLDEPLDAAYGDDQEDAA